MFNQKDATSKKLIELSKYIIKNHKRFNQANNRLCVVGLGVEFAEGMDSENYGVGKFSAYYGVSRAVSMNLLLAEYGRIDKSLQNFEDLADKTMKNIKAQDAARILRFMALKYKQKGE